MLHQKFAILFLVFLTLSAAAEPFSSRVQAYLPSNCEQLLENYNDLIQRDDFVAFYGRHLPFFEFSNFFRAPITLRGKVWPTSEHYFQAMKFEGTPHEEEVRNSPEPRNAAAIGRDRNRPLRANWELVKDRVMLEAVYAKFSQHPELREILLSTGHKILVEHTENDGYWGDKLDGSGSNKLGIMLMLVRDILGNETANPQLSIPEFMFIKFLAEEMGYKVSLSGNEYVGDARKYDLNILRQSLRNPLSTESRLQNVYHLGTPSTPLKNVPWEMRDDESYYNEIRFFIAHADGAAVTVTERDQFATRVYQGLAKTDVPAPTNLASKEFALLFHEREVETSPSRQPELITTGIKIATEPAAVPMLPGQLYGKFRVTAWSSELAIRFPALELKINQEVEIRLNEEGDEIETVRIGDFVIDGEMIFTEHGRYGLEGLLYLNNFTALRLGLVFDGMNSEHLALLDANSGAPVIQMARSRN